MRHRGQGTDNQPLETQMVVLRRLPTAEGSRLTQYGTSVADPPWEYLEGFALGPGHGVLENRPLPYASMTFEAICDLRVWEMAEKNCRLFMWTTNRWLEDAFEVLRAWRFRYRQTLVWHKLDANLPASVAPNSAEFVLVATRGNPARLSTLPSAVVATTRSGGHSAKPEAWMDYFEALSPSPRLEMFSRRARLVWDTWGNEALNHVEIA
jgi:N6-adenosine-specific RNA methylase IME4